MFWDFEERYAPPAMESVPETPTIIPAATTVELVVESAAIPATAARISTSPSFKPKTMDLISLGSFHTLQSLLRSG